MVRTQHRLRDPMVGGEEIFWRSDDREGQGGHECPPPSYSPVMTYAQRTFEQTEGRKRLGVCDKPVGQVCQKFAFVSIVPLTTAIFYRQEHREKLVMAQTTC
ncbi:hypothetical protein C0Q70_05073 [Pomacea canaliculata]|uniref:Uncharacterized protein n=1 Tax=Pomacea canaliculata TaxID=400727 RepID=A0A2T7PK92_POMCA|nr:hypothetical protein C0Q70_05073 [Pomacea canaliculata]